MRLTTRTPRKPKRAKRHFLQGFAVLFAKRYVIATTLTCAIAMPALAQPIREDSTLSTRVSSTDNTNFTITDGDRVGNNLFHSFEAFSVPAMGSASFENLDAITNIISRVTGNIPSSIEGVIKANGTANLFLINPNGIFFEENAQLDIGGSFFGSTAEHLEFADGTLFSAIAPTLPLLTVSTPTGLQLGAASQDIRVTDNGYDFLPFSVAISLVDSASSLQVSPGNTLALVGSDIRFNGGVVAAPAGRVELGSVQQGMVSLNADPLAPSPWTLGYENVQSFGDIELRSQSLVNTSDRLFVSPSPFPVVHGDRGGSIALQGHQIALRDGSLALIQSFGNEDSGNIDINARENIELDGRDRTQNVRSGFSTASLGGGKGGEIEVVTQQLRLVNGGGIRSETFNTPGGDISLQVSDTIRFDLTDPNQTVSGTVASISFGAGKAGNIDVSAEALTIMGEGISSRNIASGAGGNVTIEADRLTLSHGGGVASSVLGIIDPTQGRAFATGPGGDIIVDANIINITGVDPRTLFPSTITASTTHDGPAGNLTITTEQLRLQEGGRIDASTFATGDAGTVNITATESVEVTGRVPNSINPSLIISAANELDANLRNFFLSQGIVLPALPSGTSGDVTINTPHLAVTEGAEVTVKNDGTGNAGTLTINADTVNLIDNAEISASTQQGEGGNLSLNIQASLLLRQGSKLSAEAGSLGAGGNISLATPILVAVENSDIIANAVQGAGGNIQIRAQSILGTEFREQLTVESDITASSQFGVSGIVEINNLEVTPGSALDTLPAETTDASDQIVTSCAATGSGQFVATGRGGLPPNPIHQSATHEPWRDLRPIVELISADTDGDAPARSDQSEQVSQVNRPPLIEATAWGNNEHGDIVLTTATAQPLATSGTAPTCLQAKTTQTS